MVDIYNAQQRSRIMALIRGRGNKSTEATFVAILRAAALTGWRRHLEISLKAVHGQPVRQAQGIRQGRRRPTTIRPDFVFRAAKLAVFLDGCFWHRCPMHYKAPTSNERYWREKINANVARDRRVDAALKSAGWRVLHLWEHELRAPPVVLRKLRRRLPRQPGENSINFDGGRKAAAPGDALKNV
ncbi:very short patch repair endonuclease [Paraburkholderia sp. BL18I3N2]|uniref:very short patch repair endonuclease n=1 Tax=Paraburkholderia sp. BL18I3N2 TaxID=1938799 RepID=UPI000D074045|nr:very short patch repair endonuclease [Paraburkholderia sp. BL18I3N2]